MGFNHLSQAETSRPSQPSRRAPRHIPPRFQSFTEDRNGEEVEEGQEVEVEVEVAEPEPETLLPADVLAPLWRPSAAQKEPRAAARPTAKTARAATGSSPALGSLAKRSAELAQRELACKAICRIKKGLRLAGQHFIPEDGKGSRRRWQGGSRIDWDTVFKPYLGSYIRFLLARPDQFKVTDGAEPGLFTVEDVAGNEVVGQEEFPTAKAKGGASGNGSTKGAQSARGGVLMGARARGSKGAKGKGQTRAEVPNGAERRGSAEVPVPTVPTVPTVASAGNGEVGKGQRLRLPRPKFPKPNASETVQVAEVKPTPKRRLAPRTVPKEPEAAKELQPEEPETTAFEDLGFNKNDFEEATEAVLEHAFDYTEDDFENMEQAFEDPFEDMDPEGAPEAHLTHRRTADRGLWMLQAEKVLIPTAKISGRMLRRCVAAT
eukprot:s1403_g3.t2